MTKAPVAAFIEDLSDLVETAESLAGALEGVNVDRLGSLRCPYCTFAVVSVLVTAGGAFVIAPCQHGDAIKGFAEQEQRRFHTGTPLPIRGKTS